MHDRKQSIMLTSSWLAAERKYHLEKEKNGWTAKTSVLSHIYEDGKQSFMLTSSHQNKPPTYSTVG